jgi:hypothetical protein
MNQFDPLVPHCVEGAGLDHVLVVVEGDVQRNAHERISQPAAILPVR